MSGVIKLLPRDASELLAEGLALHKQGQLAPAREVYEQVLRLEPCQFDALHMLGVLAIQLGQYGPAIDLIDQALHVRPESALAHSHRGTARQLLGDLDGAIADVGRAAELDPAVPDFHFNLGNALKQAGSLQAALECYERAISLRPDFAEAHNNRGIVLERLDRPQEALASYDIAIRCRPGYAEAHNNRGVVLTDLNMLADALQSHEQAARLRPQFPDAYSNCGRVLTMMRRTTEAAACCDVAIAQESDHSAAHFNKSLALLLAGDYLEGWRLYEWRMMSEQMRGKVRTFDKPQWLGQEPLAGKTILLHPEQGLGDTIQFCRYVELVAATSARVVLEVERPLVRLLQGLPGVATMVASGAALPPFDFHCSLLSLPHAFGTTLATIPFADAYLRPDPALAAGWRERLGVRRRPRIGLVWSGGIRPNRPDLRAISERRNIPLRAMAAALCSPRFEFFSLQKGEPAESEIRGREAEFWPAGNFRNDTLELGDFADTAALIDALDLVITVDTSTAHVAAAMGKPTWILSRYDGCWRWLLDRNDSPWYRSVRIYRQAADWDWGKVLRRVAADLEALFP